MAIRFPTIAVLLTALLVAAAIPGGCHTSKEDQPNTSGRIPSMTDLKGTWTLTELAGVNLSEMLPDDAPPPFIDFREDGRVAGMSGINRFSSGLDTEALRDGVLILEPIATTMMAGPPELMQLERHFLDALGASNLISIDGDRLRLLTDDSTMLAFRRAKD